MPLSVVKEPFGILSKAPFFVSIVVSLLTLMIYSSALISPATGNKLLALLLPVLQAMISRVQRVRRLMIFFKAINLLFIVFGLWFMVLKAGNFHTVWLF